MERLITTDINGNECHFQFTIEFGDEMSPDQVTFKVFSIPASAIRWFSYRVKILDEKTAKGEMMTINSCIEFAKKGIPERIIEKASEYLRQDIISSPIIVQASNYLAEPSYNAWQRLTEQNELAILDEVNHKFILFYKANKLNIKK